MLPWLLPLVCVCMFVYVLSDTNIDLTQNVLTNLNTILREGLKWHKVHLIRFWQWFGLLINIKYRTIPYGELACLGGDLRSWAVSSFTFNDAFSFSVSYFMIETFLPLWPIFMNENGGWYFTVISSFVDVSPSPLPWFVYSTCYKMSADHS